MDKAGDTPLEEEPLVVTYQYQKQWGGGITIACAHCGGGDTAAAGCDAVGCV